ncbi:glutathione S-transferase family protein [Pseudomonas sp. TUM22785]|uniref:glutathione S-transferase family protein n=1 Tax=Pseudomonas sp. TUM22785 TaxID=3019098 RepID=UPI0023059D7D|nr:glutathione S-transferase family protein [Pseudomonas sp. TUM22785]WCD79432.1 glutathione S-transferase family protein [Pseudomonas sp. TUM22785]
MIRLFQFPAGFDVPNASPFCLKLETFLRLARVQYQAQTLMDPRRGPKCKLPYIDFDGELIADTAIIQRVLTERLQLSLDDHLDDAGRGRALAVTRVCDEHLYWLLVYFRWLEEEGWQQTRQAFFGNLGPVAQRLIPALVRRKVRRDLLAQGLGRHDREDLLVFAREDLQGLTDLLGTSAFFGGERPCSADASAYGLLANLVQCTLETPLNRLAREYPHLVDYCQRMREVAWA